jgi:hypothetical protein
MAMKRIALMTATLGLGWITLAGAMETEISVLPEQRYVDAKSSVMPDLGASRVRAPVPNLHPDIGVKDKATPLRRLDTYSNPIKNNGNDGKKIYNPISIPLW